MKAFSSLGFSLLLSALPAFAAVTIATPGNGAQVASPFKLSASATACSSQPISAMGYSLDDSAQTTIVSGASLNASIVASLGSHTLHVKSWGNAGASCTSNVAIAVIQPPAIAIAAPGSGASLVSPFNVSAAAALCSNQPVVAMGYSLDDSPNTVIVSGASLAGKVAASTGSHLLHVKSWGNAGASCASSVAVNVVPAPGPSVPATATVVHNIQSFANWTASYDEATGGTSYGDMRLAAAPSLTGASRSFVSSYSNYAGERYSVSFGADTSATNFLYDAWVYLAAPSSGIANLEMDLNQVMANGQTVIYGFQCDGWSGTWDFTANAGTPAKPIDMWVHSAAPCNPRAWSTNAWHHVQVAYSRDAYGNVTYRSVWLDNVEQDINATVPSAFALGWGSTLLTNLQVDGSTSTPGTSTVMIDNLTIARW